MAAPNRGGLGSDQRFTTTILLYLKNGTRLEHGYYEMLIGTRIHSIELT